ncbi:unnamed protein product [Arabidopsis lyrata]|uniref:Predicted protein n=1 Tax=Arabidopsis lyrata subsp. lyrata TaxID=81972 RepID=D7L1S7_ARALL|nr:predicted protein [Arabidopsis lyrata subsp. lyrata]CAH8262195.1 unnamed protein product [Arabidopsis lyrata]
MKVEGSFSSGHSNFQPWQKLALIHLSLPQIQISHLRRSRYPSFLHEALIPLGLGVLDLSHRHSW